MSARLRVTEGPPPAAGQRALSDEDLLGVVRRLFPRDVPARATDAELDALIGARLGEWGGSGGPGRPWEQHHRAARQVWAAWAQPRPGRHSPGARGLCGRRALRDALRLARAVRPPHAQLGLFDPP